MKICPNHLDYPVPLIFTFAFNGYEYWCPYCNHKTGMLGNTADSTPELDDELKARLVVYTIATKAYLGACATLVCSKLEWPRGSGEWISPAQLPEDELKRCADLRRAGPPTLNMKAEFLNAP